ncbi:hypothetical protein RHMOL_Rhmol08G0276200 [Rhododendron molle]|uniref:Uncharacterized protein n=1 Tax=Rhododendron molle TaxID=49168 RepID=A0ACC0MTE3_RHOML|nr:hypothetical protein RHMOL_Rhmol08G0276200 [Rhododendron molle]
MFLRHCGHLLHLQNKLTCVRFGTDRENSKRTLQSLSLSPSPAVAVCEEVMCDLWCMELFQMPMPTTKFPVSQPSCPWLVFNHGEKEGYSTQTFVNVAQDCYNGRAYQRCTTS